MARIAHIVDTLEVGGLEKLIVNLSRFQKKSGDEVSVFSLTRSSGELVSELRSSGIKVVELNKKSGFDFNVMRNLVKACKENNIDIIHAHNPVATFYGAPAGWAAGVKSIIATRHGMANFPVNKKVEYIFRIASIFLKKVVFVAVKARESFIARGLITRKKSAAILNGIFVDDFSRFTEIDAINMRKELSINKDDTVIGIVARLNKVKGIDVLIRAMAIVKNKNKNAKCLIIGDGAERDSLLELSGYLGLKDAVIFLGKRFDIPRLLTAIDIFVLPSLSEGISLTLIEAMAASKPVVATDVGGNPEVVKNGVTGFLAPTKDENALAETILKLTGDKELCRAMGYEGRRRACEVFDIKIMAEEYSKIYRE